MMAGPTFNYGLSDQQHPYTFKPSEVGLKGIPIYITAAQAGTERVVTTNWEKNRIRLGAVDRTVPTGMFI